MNSKAPMKQSDKGNAIQTQRLGLSSSGMTAADLKIPVAGIFQGTPKEQKQFPDRKTGEIVDKLSGEAVGSTKFVPVHVYKSWAKFVKKGNQTELEYIETDLARVPAEDLKWKDDGTPPAATETHNWYLLFEDMRYPVVFRFKKTSLNEGKHLFTLESSLRSGIGKDVGLYEMTTSERDSPEGPYLVPKVNLLGDPSEDLLARAMQFAASIQSGSVSEVGDEAAPSVDHGDQDDNIPF